MRTCYINVSPKDVEHIVSQIKEQNPDGVIVLAPINPMNTYAPGKKRDVFRITFEAIIPTEAITGKNCLMNFGGMMLLMLPKNRIEPQFLKRE
ncbi:hypothetical protein BR63_19090 [Thermanaerosceptrum fracticalcis]|uniref:Uncharacterized protein n=1 Tax=Thermanaerosceptrum fracticalcis TaxID=1712410 RepID=A0A7G6E7Y5_THEFR|nr:hypothetical protein [Thermanaerosceptrum fracticalcis]QNB48189.1 hypothetical protein BR63_19090 [Thermanaerosceptrum fracticalcis]